MIFAWTWQKVLDGTKTLTTRRNEPRQEPGRIYIVQKGRGKKGIAAIIRIKYIYWVERAGDISEKEARAEGVESVEEFRSAYTKMHGKVALNEPAWRISFELNRRFV